MKRTLSTIIGTVAVLGSLGCSSTPKQTAIELFNGKDLRGWHSILEKPDMAMDQVWSVKDGILQCKGVPVGAIYRGPEVTNFRMIVEYRWPEKPANSGVFSRIHGPLKAIPPAIETQLAHGSAGDVMGLQGKKIASGQPRFFEVKAHPLAGDIAGVKKISDQEKPAGEWNRIEILAQGGHYTVWMNGVMVNDVTGVEVVKGPVGVQSEGGPIEFRRVALIPMD